ncbi:hypothetical protein [Streptomyces huiliensis]|nr:hypothetical protein [Streptomyces huiliensis]
MSNNSGNSGLAVIIPVVTPMAASAHARLTPGAAPTPRRDIP